MAAEDDFVAVGEELAEFVVGELEGVGAALGEFEEAALGAGVGAGDGAAGEDVAGWRLQPLLVWWAIIWGKDQ